jgi:hypothetical protein
METKLLAAAATKAVPSSMQGGTAVRAGVSHGAERDGAYSIGTASRAINRATSSSFSSS